MRGLKLPLFIIIPLSFAFGLAWGIKLHRDREAAAGRLKAASEIKVLAFKGVLSSDLLKDFLNEHNVKVSLTEVATPEELWEKFEASARENATIRYDVVSLMSYQIALANQLVRIQPLDTRLIKNMQAISPDFRDIPGELSHKKVIPVAWGVTGMLYNSKVLPQAPTSWDEAFAIAKGPAKVGLLSSTLDILQLLDLPGAEAESAPVDIKRPLAQALSKASLSNDFLSSASLFQRPDAPVIMQVNHGETAFPPANGPDWKFHLPENEKGSLWILSFALTRETTQTPEVHLFLDFLLERDSAVRIARSARQASTNLRVEDSDLDPKLRPSYLRQFPLIRYRIHSDFSRAQELRALLPTTFVVDTKQ